MNTLSSSSLQTNAIDGLGQLKAIGLQKIYNGRSVVQAKPPASI